MYSLSRLSSRFSPKALWHRAIQFILPHYCPLCRGLTSTYLCKDCLADFKQIEHACSHCAIPLPLLEGQNICAECLKEPPPFSSAICLYSYEYPFAHLLHRFKNRGDERVIAQVCRDFAKKLQVDISQRPSPEVLISVPIHWTKRWKRGFNQSEIICRFLSKELEIPSATALKKFRRTPMQKALSRKQRLRNLEGSFKICTKELSGKHVAIIDDVITTGSTMRILSHLCVDAGAKSVEVWALSRTPKQR